MTSAPDHLTETALRREDAAAFADLLTHLNDVDGIGDPIDVVDAGEMLSVPDLDLAHDSLAVRAGDDLVAYGMVTVGSEPEHEGYARASLSGGVHASYRRRGLGSRILQFTEQRAGQLVRGRHPDRPYHLRADGGVGTSTVRHLLTAHGYWPARTWRDYVRPLPGDRLELPTLEGVRLEAPEDSLSDAVRTAHNAAFRDHWGSAPISPQEWRKHWESEKSVLTVSTVARDEDGRVLSYAFAKQFVPRRLYIGLVGTVPEARGRGVAYAALAATIRRAADSGEYDTVELDVDADSPTGATRLYERLGFAPVRETVSYQKDVPAAPAR